MFNVRTESWSGLITVHKEELPRYGVCTSKKMEKTRFEDLTIKLGYPYVLRASGQLGTYIHLS